MLRKALVWQLAMLISVVFMLSGCATTLAPQYDKALVDGLTTSNTAAMEFLAFMSGGTQKDNFAQRKEKYANVIGRFDALKIQADARPVPKNNVVDAITDHLKKRGVTPDDSAVGPSAHAMAQISKTFSVMRDIDEKQGLKSGEVQAIKNQVSIYMEQALTYESFLER